ncbi:MAG: hypothetical protein ACTHOH_15305 [Lysobacteraceae bacterium]
MSIVAWFVMMALGLTAAIWMIALVFRDSDGIAGLFSLFCFPYAIRHAYRLRAANPWPIRLLGVAALATAVWLVFLLGDIGREIGFLPIPPGKMAEALKWLAIVGGAILLLIACTGMAMTGTTWLAMNAFDREGWLHGFIAILFWPYALFYGISRYSMNRKPVIIGLAGFGGCLLLSLLPAVWPASSS